jgi:hypothetical protein
MAAQMRATARAVTVPPAGMFELRTSVRLPQAAVVQSAGPTLNTDESSGSWASIAAMSGSGSDSSSTASRLCSDFPGWRRRAHRRLPMALPPPRAAPRRSAFRTLCARFHRPRSPTSRRGSRSAGAAPRRIASSVLHVCLGCQPVVDPLLAGRPDPLIHGLGTSVLRCGLPSQPGHTTAGALLPAGIDETFSNTGAP